MAKVFKKLFLASALFIQSWSSFGCELVYQGVVGSGASGIAVLRDEGASANQFVKVNEGVKNCDFRVLKVARGKITLTDGMRILELTPDGASGSEDKMVLAQKMVAEAESEIARAYDVNIDQLNEIGDKLIEEGKLSREEVAALIAEERRSYPQPN